ncbi:MAG: DUF3224 domain-containing protein [Actinomycetota bacterium]
MDTITYTHQAVTRFQVSSWSETTLVDIDGTGTRHGEVYTPTRGMSRVEAGYTYTGDLVGSSTMAYLLAYHPGSAPAFGLEHVTGSLEGREGSFVLRHVGEHDAEAVTVRVEVLPGMGTGELAGLRGEGQLRIAGHSEDGYELVLEYSLG